MKIYAYTTPQYKDKYIKVGQTERDIYQRISEQFPVKTPEINPFTILLEDIAIDDKGNSFTDHLIHKRLIDRGINRINGEWFECDINELKSVIAEIKTGKRVYNRFETFEMRPEQHQAVDVTSDYFIKNPDNSHFLWNAKMRFGKTFTSYKLAQKMGWKRVLILTYKPAVQSSWKSDLNNHIDFIDWQFIDKDTPFEDIDETKPMVWFASFQDILGRDNGGNIKEKYEAVHIIDWDCIIIDEYHFGAWRDAAKELYDNDENMDERNIPLNSSHYLYLSGTPFRAIANGDFTEDQIFNWTYPDEQRAKRDWDDSCGLNPYLSLPALEMRTYRMPDEIRDIARNTEMNEFSLNDFFKCEEKDNEYRFIHETEVQKWLDIIRGRENIFRESKDIRLPFEDTSLLPSLNHILWFMPNVSSCKAMKELLGRKNNSFYNEYEVVVAAGIEAGSGIDAVYPVQDAIKKNDKTITLSCGKLTTGVTIREWSAIFFLRDIKSPESYFQAAFRVQSPYIDKDTKEIYKHKCYIVDFAPQRALELIVDYCDRLSDNEVGIKQRIDEFLYFLPVLCYDGYSIESLNPEEVMDFAATGESSSLLARKWESIQLISIDKDIIEKLMDSDILQKLEQMEDFRSLRENFKTVISNEDSLRKNINAPSKEQGKIKRDNNRIIKDIKEKLRKFLTRIPLFMYLTDYREECLKHVITNIEPELFEKTIGLSISDFEYLCEIRAFDIDKLNRAVLSFKQFEKSSLRYIGGKIIANDVGVFI